MRGRGPSRSRRRPRSSRRKWRRGAARIGPGDREGDEREHRLTGAEHPDERGARDGRPAERSARDVGKRSERLRGARDRQQQGEGGERSGNETHFGRLGRAQPKPRQTAGRREHVRVEPSPCDAGQNGFGRPSGAGRQRRALAARGCALAEDARFELARGFPQHAFQACALGHYANPPRASVSVPCGTSRLSVGAWPVSCARPLARRYPVNSPRAGRQQG